MPAEAPMAVATFDTLKFANTLKAAGVPPQQAEAQAVAFAEVIQLNLKDLVTKDDLDRAVNTIKTEIEQLARDLRHEFKEELAKLALQNARLDGRMVLIQWMLGLVITGIAGLIVRLVFFKL
jgi:G3E family GTPase